EPNRDALLAVLDDCLADLGAARDSLAADGTLGPLVDRGHAARRAYEDAAGPALARTSARSRSCRAHRDGSTRSGTREPRGARSAPPDEASRARRVRRVRPAGSARPRPR